MKKLLLISFFISSFHINTVHAGCIEAFIDKAKGTNKQPLQSTDKKGVEKLKHLIKEGKFDVTMLDDQDWTPLHRAIKLGDLEVLQILIDAGSDVNARDKDGRTPLHLVRRDIEIAELLIENGADVNARDRDGNTPINEVENVKIAEILVEHGADPHTRNNKGYTPLHKAKSEELAEFFVKQGVNINAKNKYESTASSKHTYDAIEAVINHGADKRFSKHSQKEGTNKQPLQSTNKAGWPVI